MGNEAQQLFVLERLTRVRKEMTLDKLHVPDLDTLILNRIGALEQDPFSTKKDQELKQTSDKASQTVPETPTPRQSERDHWLLTRTSFDFRDGPSGTYSTSLNSKVGSLSFDIATQQYTVRRAPNSPQSIHSSYCFSPDKVRWIGFGEESGQLVVRVILDGQNPMIHMQIEVSDPVELEQLLKQLEEQTGLRAQFPPKLHKSGHEKAAEGSTNGELTKEELAKAELKSSHVQMGVPEYKDLS